jgi:putative Mn2+ efflux pump MntP
MNEIMFYINSILLGIGLAMDAFSVSLADGLSEPKMKNSKMSFIAGLFAFFQALMPMIGWICVHTVVKYFEKLQIFIPFIALALLSYIGIKMLIDGIKNKECENGCCKLCMKTLLIQALATSIDALSVGFTIASHSLVEAMVSVLIIGTVTFMICMAGIFIGKKFGTALSGKASIFGGVILIAIGIEIFVTGMWF